MGFMGIGEQIKGNKQDKKCSVGQLIPLSKASYRDCQPRMISYGPSG